MIAQPPKRSALEVPPRSETRPERPPPKASLGDCATRQARQRAEIARRSSGSNRSPADVSPAERGQLSLHAQGGLRPRPAAGGSLRSPSSPANIGPRRRGSARVEHGQRQRHDGPERQESHDQLQHSEDPSRESRLATPSTGQPDEASRLAPASVGVKRTAAQLASLGPDGLHLDPAGRLRWWAGQGGRGSPADRGRPGGERRSRGGAFLSISFP